MRFLPSTGQGTNTLKLAAGVGWQSARQLKGKDLSLTAVLEAVGELSCLSFLCQLKGQPFGWALVF